MSIKKAPVSLAVSLGLSYLAAGLGSLGTMGAIQGWYATAPKPWFTPPNWVFGPAWALWYTTMAIAAWWVYNTPHKHRKKALIAYGTQLALNAAWSPVFFGAELLLPGTVIALLLAIAVFVTMCLFHMVKPKAGYLLAPYFGWCVFAFALSSALLYLGPLSH